MAHSTVQKGVAFWHPQPQLVNKRCNRAPAVTGKMAEGCPIRVTNRANVAYAYCLCRQRGERVKSEGESELCKYAIFVLSQSCIALQFSEPAGGKCAGNLCREFAVNSQWKLRMNKYAICNNIFSCDTAYCYIYYNSISKNLCSC